MPERPAASGEAPTEDSLLGGRVRLLQPGGGHRAGTDAVLLAAAVDVRAGDLVVDLGSGSGAVGLMVAARGPDPIKLIFVEREPDLVELCRANIARNGLADRARAVEADVLRPNAHGVEGIESGSADVVVTNPPFLEAGRGRSSPVPARAAARELPAGGLDRWVASATDLLGPGGRFAMIHRADHLAECLSVLARRFGAIRLRCVHPRADAPANRILLTGVKGSRAPLQIAPALVLHEADGAFTAEAAALHRGA